MDASYISSSEPSASVEGAARVDTRGAGARRLAALVLSGLAVAGTLLGALWTQRVALQAAGVKGIFIETKVVPALARWRAKPRSAGLKAVALFGDSVVDWGPVSLGAQLEAEVRARVGETRFVTVAYPGFRALHFYSLLDDVLAGAPDVAVVEVNPAAFAGGWPVLYRNLSRKLSFRRAVAVHQTLAGDQLTLLDPWLYRAEAALHTLYLFDGARRIGLEQLGRFGDAVNAALRLRTVPADPRPRGLRGPLDASFARSRYAGDLVRHPQVVALRELVRELRARNVARVLYVTPVNVDRLTALGLAAEIALPEQIAALREAVGASPAEWLDLHAAARSGEFADATEHLKPAATRRVAVAVAQAVTASLR